MIKKINKRTGFTLVELLVVISIMGILTVMIAGSFVGAQQKSRDAARKANLKSVADALNMYYSDNGVYPDGSSIDITYLMKNQSEFKVGNVIYMKKMPKETVSSLKQFEYEAGAKSFRLYANLENSKDGDCVGDCNGTTYGKVSTGCCYVITSSNIGVTSPLL